MLSTLPPLKCHAQLSLSLQAAGCLDLWWAAILSVVSGATTGCLVLCRAAAQTENGTKAEAQVVVKIDNESDPFATVVTVEFGDYLGELVDTVSGLIKHTGRAADWGRAG